VSLARPLSNGRLRGAGVLSDGKKSMAHEPKEMQKMKVYAAICAALLLCAANVSYAAMDAETENFVKATATRGIGDLELGRLAREKTKQADVLKFAQNLIDSHGKMNTELGTLAAKFDFKLLTALTQEQLDQKARLSKLEGRAFDREYTAAMIDSHTKNIDSFATQSKTGKIPEFKDYATRTLPMLNEHLVAARALDATLAKSAALDMEPAALETSFEPDRTLPETASPAEPDMDREAAFEKADRFESTEAPASEQARETYVSYDSACDVCHEECKEPFTTEMKDYHIFSNTVYDNDWNAGTTEKIHPDYDPKTSRW
jgi:putative membrane protein